MSALASVTFHGDIAVIQMNDSHENRINVDFCEALARALDEAAKRCDKRSACPRPLSGY